MKTIIGGREYIGIAGEIIKKGGLVAFPTETVYGLGADAFNAGAVRKIFEAKGRPQDNPLIVHALSAPDAEKACYMTAEAEMLFKRFSPGPLTLVLKKRAVIPAEVSAGLDTVGVRIPSHPVASEFLAAAETLVAAPSANISSRISPTSPAHVYEDLNGRIPLILDGGRSEIGIESTVLDLTKEVPVILRPGAVTAEEIAELLPRVINHKGEAVVLASPGMKYKHYAPVSECVLAESSGSACAEYDRKTAAGKKAVILCLDGYETGNRNAVRLGETGSDYAKNIYAAMREAEKIYDILILQYIYGNGINYSIMNRLIKSAQGKFIQQ